MVTAEADTTVSAAPEDSMNTANPFPTHASPNSPTGGLNSAISNNLTFATSTPNQDPPTMATATADATTPVAPVATNATANPFFIHASPNNAAGGSNNAIFNNLNVTATTNAPLAVSIPSLPPHDLNEGEDLVLAAVDIPDDVCKAKVHYVANNRSMKPYHK